MTRVCLNDRFRIRFSVDSALFCLRACLALYLLFFQLCVFASESISLESNNNPNMPDSHPLVMGYSEWLPLYGVNEQGQVHGIDIEIISQALQPFGYRFSFKPIPWTRNLQALAVGTVDIVSSSTYAPERKEYARYSKPYYVERFQLYVLPQNKQRFANKSLSQLLHDGFRLGHFRGSFYSEPVNQLLKLDRYQSQIKAANTNELNFRQLQSGRLDGFLMEASRFHQLLQDGLDPTHFVPLITVAEQPQYFLFSKSTTDEQLVQQFNLGLETLKQNGQYQAIFKRYQAEDLMLLPEQ